nr:immunity 53 family protein [Paenibacillus tyrfis]
MFYLSNIEWLQQWYSEQCDGDWEHGFGIKIDTIDNPGWYLQVDLTDTPLLTKGFKDLKIERNEDDWLSCKVKNDTFIGVGGPLNLNEILRIFREWAMN